MTFYKCEKCGAIATFLKGSCTLKCCDEDMIILDANESDGAEEKHVPAVTVNGNTVYVQIGEVAHPMLEEHHIEFIALETEQGIQVKYLKPGEAPDAYFALAEGDRVIAVYEHCNIHGLWKIVL
ncbi:MAG: desulfoferrodoxin Dfx [Clostridia bacterium]|nr:desulfoferrodoxin Dfx [Clostridia bacterium]